jgi:coenzyme F420-reducing hydrogenase alpha subunit
MNETLAGRTINPVIGLPGGVSRPITSNEAEELKKIGEEAVEFALFTLKEELVALSRALMSSDQMLKEEHGLAAKTVRVIMPADTYPRFWKTGVNRTVHVPS